MGVFCLASVNMGVFFKFRSQHLWSYKSSPKPPKPDPDSPKDLNQGFNSVGPGRDSYSLSSGQYRPGGHYVPPPAAAPAALTASAHLHAAASSVDYSAAAAAAAFAGHPPSSMTCSLVSDQHASSYGMPTGEQI